MSKKKGKPKKSVYKKPNKAVALTIEGKEREKDGGCNKADALAKIEEIKKVDLVERIDSEEKEQAQQEEENALKTNLQAGAFEDENGKQAVLTANEKEEEIDFAKLIEKKRYSLFCKRLFDLVASLLGLIILSPFLLIISMIIITTSRGGIFFCQTRVGKNGKEFSIIKFRTMVKNAESKGMQITVGKDKRITKIGKFLRKAKLDELPQLINVFLGQMSFVGYRPEVPKYVAMYTEYQKNIFKIKPGITDLASIEYRDENEVLDKAEDAEAAYINEVMPKKLELNLEYVKRLGFWFDIGVIIKTFFAILK